MRLSAARPLPCRHDDAVECPFGVFHPTHAVGFPAPALPTTPFIPLNLNAIAHDLTVISKPTAYVLQDTDRHLIQAYDGFSFQENVAVWQAHG